MEEGHGEGGKVALLLSLSQSSDESATLRRVKHIKARVAAGHACSLQPAACSLQHATCSL